MGRKTLDGVFKFYNSRGLPLSVVFDFLLNNDCQVCWISFYKEAMECGWTRKTILSRLEEPIIDVYGKNYWLHVEKTLKEIFKE